MAAAYHITNSTHKLFRLVDLIPSNVDTIFDVGGNCGLFSAFARQSYPHAEIHCFEPSPDLLPVLKKNLREKEVQIHTVAVGEREGTATFFINPSSQQTNSLNRDATELFSSTASIREEKVREISLDEFANRRDIQKIDVLKIDVQGSEGSVLRGCRKYLSSVRYLFIESTWMDIESIKELVPFALKLGFDYLSVVNSVYMGADILLSREKIDSDKVLLSFNITEDSFNANWS